MGKNVSLYLDDDSEELVGSIDGRGTLINNLIKEHFSNDEDFLQRKLRALEIEINSVRAKLKSKWEEKAKIAKEREEELSKPKPISNEQQRQIDMWAEALKEGKISQEEHDKAFYNGKFFKTLAYKQAPKLMKEILGNNQ